MCSVDIKKIIFIISIICVQPSQAESWYTKFTNTITHMWSQMWTTITKTFTKEQPPKPAQVAALLALSKTSPTNKSAQAPSVSTTKVIPKQSSNNIRLYESLVPYGIAMKAPNNKSLNDYVSFASFDNRFTIFTLFDGHDGNFASKTLAFGSGKQAMDPLITNAPEKSSSLDIPPLQQIIIDKLRANPSIDVLLQDPEKLNLLFKEAFEQADALLLANKASEKNSGASAGVVLLDTIKNYAHIAFVGNVQIKIITRFTDKNEERFSTKIHNYYNEATRVFLTGEEIRYKLTNTEDFHQKQLLENRLKIHQKSLGLIKKDEFTLSRVFGAHNKKLVIPSLTAKPEVHSIDLFIKNRHKIIIGSAGLWEGLRDNILVRLMGRTIFKTSLADWLLQSEHQYNSQELYNQTIKNVIELRMGNDNRASYFAQRLQKAAYEESSSNDVAVIYISY